MFGQYFYHEKIRKSVAIFGRLFNNIYVVNKNSSNQVINQIKVPLAYAPKAKYLDRIRENPDLDNDTKVAVKLPRMSFEITGFAYDQARQLSKTSNFNSPGANTNSRQKFYAPVPYDISFQLSIYAKSHDDALQIVEQILPFFNPQYSITIKPFATEYPDFKEDVPVAIRGVSFSDDYESTLEQRRTIVYTLDFEMKINFHGPISSQSIIRTATGQIFDIEAGLNDSDVLVESVVVTPTPDGVSADSDYGFNTDIDLAFNDSDG